MRLAVVNQIAYINPCRNCTGFYFLGLLFTLMTMPKIFVCAKRTYLFTVIPSNTFYTLIIIRLYSFPSWVIQIFLNQHKFVKWYYLLLLHAFKQSLDRHKWHIFFIFCALHHGSVVFLVFLARNNHQVVGRPTPWFGCKVFPSKSFDTF
jgi:hypothetical protein